MKVLYKIKARISRLVKRPAVVPPYELKRDMLRFYKNKYKINYFIETGTFMGDTVFYLKDDFKQIISIELAEDLAGRAKERFQDEKHIQILHGDSGQILNKIIQNIDQPILFWLDGHYSSEFFVGENFIRTAKGEKNTPVEEELKWILQSSVQHVVLIDDARLFTGLNDYPSVSRIRKLVNRSAKSYGMQVKNDMIIIEPMNSRDNEYTK